MQLSNALRIQKGDIAVFIGAENSNLAVRRLAQELTADGWRVAITTTAKMHPLEPADVILMRVGYREEGGLGIPISQEPAIPLAATLIVPLIKFDAPKGQLAPPPAQWSDTIKAHAALLRDISATARVTFLLDGEGTEGDLQAARHFACRLKELSSQVEAVLIGALTQPDLILERWERVGALVLAAGGARRFGSPKQLLPFGRSFLLHHILDQALASPLDQVILVLGAYADAIEETLACYRDQRRLQVVRNSLWETGLSSSIRAGLAALDSSMAAALLLLADQPYVTSDLITRILAQRARTGARLVAPLYRGQRGNPVLFDRAFFGELAGVEGDQGGRQIVARHQEELVGIQVAADAFLDIDTLSDYERALHILGSEEG